MQPTWVLSSPLLEVLGLSWPRSLLLLVPLLLLGWPWLLAAWALYRLRATGPASSLQPGPEPNHSRAGARLWRAYLMANYAASVQLSSLREGRALPLVSLLVVMELGQVYLALYLLVTGRTFPYSISVLLLGLVAGTVYKLVLPRIAPWAQRYRTVSTHEALSPHRQSAWGLLGQALLWGSFTFIFVCIILREKYDSL